MSGYIIVKRGRDARTPYTGPACASAWVEPGRVYASRAAAEEDAERLSQVNPAGFDVREVAGGDAEELPEDAPVWSEFFNEGRYEVRHVVGSDKVSVFYKRKAVEVSGDLVFFMLKEIRDLRAELAEVQEPAETAEDPTLSILRELKDHQLRGQTVDPADHVVVRCRARGEVVVNGVTPVVWHRNHAALAEATCCVVNAGRTGADRYEVVTLGDYLADCRAREESRDAAASRLSEKVQDLRRDVASRFEEVRARAQADLRPPASLRDVLARVRYLYVDQDWKLWGEGEYGADRVLLAVPAPGWERRVFAEGLRDVAPSLLPELARDEDDLAAWREFCERSSFPGSRWSKRDLRE